jgi:hypothetical protein
MTNYTIKKGQDDDGQFITIFYKDRRLTKPLFFGLHRFLKAWFDLPEYEKTSSARRNYKK